MKFDLGSSWHNERQPHAVIPTIIFQTAASFKSMTTDCSTLTYLQYIRSQKETPIWRLTYNVRVESGHKHFPIPCSTELMKIDAWRSKTHFDSREPTPSCFSLPVPTVLLICACSQALGNQPTFGLSLFS